MTNKQTCDTALIWSNFDKIVYQNVLQSGIMSMLKIKQTFDSLDLVFETEK